MLFYVSYLHVFVGITMEQALSIVTKTIYGILILINIVGNTIVCLVVRRFPSMKTPMNYLLVHLAICDIFSGLFYLPRGVFQDFFTHPSGSVGVFFCKCITYGSLGWVTSAAGIYTLVAIAWERYNAITKPLAPRFSNKKVLFTVMVSWLVGIVIWLPTGIADVWYQPESNLCDFHWPDYWGMVTDAIFWGIISTYFPLSVMSFLYGKVVRILWFSSNRVNDVSQRSLMKSRKKVTKSAITVTLILFVCWTPNILYYLISSVEITSMETWKENEYAKTSPVFYKISHGMILFNHAINPFIYALQDRRFRRCMKGVMVCWKSSEVGGEQSSLQFTASRRWSLQFGQANFLTFNLSKKR